MNFDLFKLFLPFFVVSSHFKLIPVFEIPPARLDLDLDKPYMFSLKGQAGLFFPFLWLVKLRLRLQGPAALLHLLNTSLEAPQVAALDHLVKEDLGHSGVQQLQVIVETNQQPQPV